MSEAPLAAVAGVIAAHVAEWESAHVELAVYGTDDARAIALHLAQFCAEVLGASPARALFHVSSIGCVTGLELEGGRRVVVKGHQPQRPCATLTEIVRLQRYLAEKGLAATPVLAGPLPLARGLAIVEEYVDAGVIEDAHNPAIREALAGGLHAIVETTRPLVASSSLEVEPPPATLWPVPHSKLFDFDATAVGAEYIDTVARAARALLADVASAGDLVIGHADWRAEHVRFEGTRIVAAYDWDSLCKRREAALVGASASGFCADWSRNERVAPAPTLEEARAYVDAYERSRGAPFDPRERQLMAASFAYACAYTARGGHALGQDHREVPGTFGALVWRERERLLTI